MEDDFFYEDSDQKISNQEEISFRRRAINLGMMEEITKETSEYDNEELTKGFVEGYDQHFKENHIAGQLEMLNYMIQKAELNSKIKENSGLAKSIADLIANKNKLSREHIYIELQKIKDIIKTL